MLRETAVIAAALLVVAAQAPPEPAPHSINLTPGWRQSVYAHAREKLNHAAWGWRHAERDYLIGREIAREEKITFDDDVLFAAAFLHDMGAIAPFAKDGVDHADRSVELAQPLLQEAGFPMHKFPRVRAAILGHMSDKEPTGSEAILLHDADTLDFMGATGIARQLSVTSPRTDMDFRLTVLRGFIQELPPRLKTRSARRMSRERTEFMRRFLRRLARETPSGAKI